MADPNLSQLLSDLGVSLPQQGVADAIIEPRGLMRGLPFFPGNGTKTHSWKREGALPVMGGIPLGGAVGQVSMTMTTHSTEYKWFGGDLPFDTREVDINSNVEDAKAHFAMKMAKSMRITINKYLIYGNATTSPLQFDGTHAIMPLADPQTLNVGAALAWSHVDDAVALLGDEAWDAAGFWMTSLKGESHVRALVRAAAGGAQPAEIMDENFGGPFLELRGKPVIPNRSMTNTEDSGAFYSLMYIATGEEWLHGRIPLGGNGAITVEDKGSPVGFVQDVIRVIFGMCLVMKSKLGAVRIARLAA